MTRKPRRDHGERRARGARTRDHPGWRCRVHRRDRRRTGDHRGGSASARSRRYRRGSRGSRRYVTGRSACRKRWSGSRTRTGPAPIPAGRWGLAWGKTSLIGCDYASSLCVPGSDVTLNPYCSKIGPHFSAKFWYRVALSSVKRRRNDLRGGYMTDVTNGSTPATEPADTKVAGNKTEGKAPAGGKVTNPPPRALPSVLLPATLESARYGDWGRAVVHNG